MSLPGSPPSPPGRVTLLVSADARGWTVPVLAWEWTGDNIADLHGLCPAARRRLLPHGDALYLEGRPSNLILPGGWLAFSGGRPSLLRGWAADRHFVDVGRTS